MTEPVTASASSICDDVPVFRDVAREFTKAARTSAVFCVAALVAFASACRMGYGEASESGPDASATEVAAADGSLDGTPNGAKDGEPDGTPSDAQIPDADLNDGSSEEAGAVDPPVTVRSVRTPFIEVAAGDLGVPIEVDLESKLSSTATLYGLDFLFSRDSSEFSWQTATRLPLELDPSATTTVRAFLWIGPNVAAGPLDLNARGVVMLRDSSLLLAGPAAQPAQLTVTPPEELTDTDGDSLSDILEASLGSTPHNPDTDSDSIDDGIEAPRGVPIDSDGDGTPDLLDDDSDNGGEPDLLEEHRGSLTTWSVDDRPFRVLTVNDTNDDLASTSLIDPYEAGPTLSLREALTIASNRRGPDRIVFDWRALPSGTRIELSHHPSGTRSILPPLQDPGTFIDGAGIVLHFDAASIPSDAADSLLTITATGCAVRGLELDVTPSANVSEPLVSAFSVVSAVGTADSVLSDMRIVNRGVGKGIFGIAIDASGSSNTLVYLLRAQADGVDGLNHGVRLGSAPNARVVRSRIEVLRSALTMTGAGSTAEENILFNDHRATVTLGSRTQLRRNLIRGQGTAGLSIEFASDLLIEENVLHDGAGDAIVLGESVARATLRRNSISHNGGVAIACQSSSCSTPPPVLERVAPDLVAGTHPGPDGVIIEVFADDLDEADLYVGTTRVFGGAFGLILTKALPLNRMITATATSLDGHTSVLSSPIEGPRL